MNRRLFLLLSLASACMAPLAAQAASFPDRPIRIIVPYAPGGTTDMLARVVGKHMSDKLGQSVIVENKPGANGMLGSSMVAKAAPDGYTLGIATPGNHAANASLYKEVPYDTIKDFTAVSQAVNSPMILVAHPSLGVKTVAELIAKAKAEPGAIVYASGGTGSSMHLAMEQFAKMAGIKMTHVPYKGSGNSYIDLLAGRVSLLMDISPQALPRVRNGELIALGTASEKRLPELPDVPTIDEAGVAGYRAGSWYGFVGPAGIPKQTLDTLNSAITAALHDPEIEKKLQAAGLQIVASKPAEFQSFIEAEVKKSAQIIKDAGIQPE
ncbi:Bug family tripartite tricarboxylate transporter substrate binding protein [Pollutimonas sp. M17]|uniref:Bug family tripartite tricarboxylate transporter substrate binding protein n=1 Tax=Pollutimonas sp. M17 TaxID=2962065 RepID=UPI0021F452B4|nr:tripartite tricarboxylate transporter substrate binding protein [Pollutimonas sp. M17]UYO93460.1 tripartite tricarboxylate transporter substrate binding protein [Pollutimonas sp. M17]HWK71744.1 tripartite tricarboxylate transporter substrate binding protein [Burkholderiaceae bacterium]